MSDRRPSPETQVRAALEAARRAAQPFDTAWPLATKGQVCDSYTSARGARQQRNNPVNIPAEYSPAGEQLALGDDGPPNLRQSVGQRRCAGCDHVQDAGYGPARCGLYDAPIFPGVLWPHRTDERHEWQAALAKTSPEWRRAYDDIPSPVQAYLDMLMRQLTDTAGGERDDPGLTQGSVAA